MNSTFKRIVFVVSILVLTLVIYQYINDSQQIHQPTWTEFERQIEKGNIQTVTIVSSPEGNAKEISGTYSKPIENYSEFELAPLTLPGSGGEIVNRMQERNIEIKTKVDEESWWTMLLVNSLPVLLIVGIWLYFIYRTRQSMGGGGGMMGVGESKAELYEEETPDVTFEDVAGYSGPKNEVQQVIEFLQKPEKFDRLGGEIPKGVLMVGPPGTGKTLTARAIAGEAGVPFLSTEGSDFMEMFVGVGASRVRDLFERAKELSPAIIFIDEIDSVGRKRGAGVGGGHDEREQTLNQLLSEMDGFEPNAGVILIAATNRPDILDQALLRAGRFDRQVTFEMPTLEERKDILKLHAGDKPLSEDVELDKIASGTPGFSGADLKNLLNEAALLAGEKEADEVTKEIVEEARDKVLMGLRREEMAISDDEKETMATHESGHTLVAFLSDNTDPVHKVTIIPRGRALGATQQLPLEEKKMYTREDLMGKLAVLMAGRVAETLKMDTVTNGAQDDLRRATKMARKMVLQWGMSPELGNVAFQDGDDNVFLGEEMGNKREYSEETSEKIDQAVTQIVEEATEEARRIMLENEASLDKLVEVLSEKETLNAEEITSLIDEGELPPEEEIEESEEAAAEPADETATDEPEAGETAEGEAEETDGSEPDPEAESDDGTETSETVETEAKEADNLDSQSEDDSIEKPEEEKIEEFKKTVEEAKEDLDESEASEADSNSE